MTTNLPALIAELEAAVEGSRELDVRIAVALFETVNTGDDLIYAKLPNRSDNVEAGTFWRKSRSGLSLQTAPRYTQSLDVAITLPSAGRCIEIERWANGRGHAHVHKGIKEGRGYFHGHGATPPIALCIAVLRARQAEEHSDDR